MTPLLPGRLLAPARLTKPTVPIRPVLPLPTGTLHPVNPIRLVAEKSTSSLLTTPRLFEVCRRLTTLLSATLTVPNLKWSMTQVCSAPANRAQHLPRALRSVSARRRPTLPTLCSVPLRVGISPMTWT